MTILIGIAIMLLFFVSFAPQVAGAVIARRAWKRNGWPEARLAYRMFLAGLIIAIASIIIFPFFSLIVENYVAFDLIFVTSMVAGTAQGIALIMIVVALYRLSRRAARGAPGSAGTNGRPVASPGYSGGPPAWLDGTSRATSPTGFQL